MKDVSVSLVIPAYQEKEAIAEVVAAHHKALSKAVRRFEIIVVDDGSTDGTAEAVDSAKARVIRHPANGGYGRALLTGIRAAELDWVLMTDADGSYPVAETVRLLEHAPEFDLVIGARQGSHYWGSPVQMLLRMIYLRMARFVSGEDIPDANSGARLVRRALVAGPDLVRCLGYSFSTTMTLSFLQEGRFVKFMPIEFSARAGGRSKVKPVRDILRTLQLMTEVMIAYNPLKLFVTITALLALAAAFLLWDGQLLAACVVGFSALFSFSVGCVLDTLRMHLRPR